MIGDTLRLLRQRLIEEREKNAALNAELNSLSDALVELEAELAEALRREQALLRLGADAAMKEENKHA